MSDNMLQSSSIRLLFRVLLLAGALLLPLSGQAAGNIGAVKSIVEFAYGSPPGASRSALYARDGVVAREVVETVPDGALHILFNDETNLRLGSDSKVTLDKFVYNTDNNGGELLLSMGKGAFRFISGNVAKQGIRLTTPTCYIGVRGTDFTVVVAASGATQVVVLEGVVEITPINGGAAATVNAGQGASVGAAGASVEISQGASPPSDPGLQDQTDEDTGDRQSGGD